MAAENWPPALLRNSFDLTVHDLDRRVAAPLLENAARRSETPREMAEAVDMIITCLPSPAAGATVMEAEDGILAGLGPSPGWGPRRVGALAGLGPGKIWLEMSTTDEAEVNRPGEKVIVGGAVPLDCPVSGGCHRSATGNIAIFVGGERETFKRALPVPATMGQHILHTGLLGAASILKVITNYPASVHPVALGEALSMTETRCLSVAANSRRGVILGREFQARRYPRPRIPGAANAHGITIETHPLNNSNP